MAYQPIDPSLLTPPKKISDLYNSLFPGMLPTPGAGSGPIQLAPVTRNLPNGAGSYQAPVIPQPTAPVAPPAPVRAPASAPVVPTGQGAPAALDYSKYTDPVTGQVMSPQQYADFLANKATGGSIPNYAGNSITQGPQTTPQLQSTATDLNNQRNDIATGTTDPYKVASKSGIAFSPTELTAIEKAYAGIYDPALKDVQSKLDAKAKLDASALDLKNQLALQAQKHLDDVALKETPSGTTNTSGVYLAGADPVVDAWVANINAGKNKITDIPASQAALRNQVSQGLSQSNSSGDDVFNATATAINDLNDMVTNNKGFMAAVGYKGPIGSIFGPLAGTQAADFVSKLKQVTSGPVLTNLSLLKGIGRVSQKEFDTLQSAITSLNTSESEEQFKKDLKTLTDFTASQAAGQKTGPSTGTSSAGISVTDPTGGVHTFPTQAAADQFKKAIGQ